MKNGTAIVQSLTKRRGENTRKKKKKKLVRNAHPFLLVGIQVQRNLCPPCFTTTGATANNGGGTSVDIGVVFLVYMHDCAETLGRASGGAGMAIEVAVTVVGIAVFMVVGSETTGAGVAVRARVRVLGGETLVLVLVLSGLPVLDEGVDDVVLQAVHDEGEDHHDKGNLELLVALGPAEGPVADLGDPRREEEDDEDADLHAEQAAEVNDGLLEPPPDVGGVAVVAGLDGLARFAERREGDDAG